jgi:hypothetical protein
MIVLASVCPISSSLKVPERGKKELFEEEKDVVDSLQLLT